MQLQEHLLAGDLGGEPALRRVGKLVGRKEERAARDNLAEMAKFDQEEFYLNTEDYRAYAARTLAEQRQILGDLGLRLN